MLVVEGKMSEFHKKKIVVVLLSGGMDSTTLLYYVLKKSYDFIITVSFNYGQRHKKELESAKKISRDLGVKHEIINIEIPKFKGSPLVDHQTYVPDQKENRQPVTVVPFRNSLFLLHACAIAKFYQASEVYIAAIDEDQHSYPDCRPEFFKTFQKMIDSQEENNIRIVYPFVTKNKTDIVKLGESLNVPWKDTWTCYKGLDEPCNLCDACKERNFAFSELNIHDPILPY